MSKKKLISFSDAELELIEKLTKKLGSKFSQVIHSALALYLKEMGE